MIEEKKSKVPALFLFLGMLAAAFFCFVAYRESGYYLLSPGQRALHPAHDMLRSSGPLGLSVGFLGAALMLLNLTYLIRKELFFSVAWLGQLRSWMAFHVLTGLAAAAFVGLHSGFLVRSSLGGVSFWAMMVVVFTGLLGRFIYANTPRSLDGVELELDDLRRGLEANRASLEALGIPPALFQKTFSAPKKYEVREGDIFHALRAVVMGSLELRGRFSEFRAALRSSPQLAANERRILPLAKRYFKELQWLDRYQELRALMSGWRFYHRWLAIVLCAAVLFHILIALRIGHVHLGRISLP